MQKFQANSKSKLSDFLLDKYQGSLSYGKFCKLLKNKDIKLNGKRICKDCLVNVGDTVECYYDGDTQPLEILFKDENLLVCNKPQGITSEDFFNRVNQDYPTCIFTHRLDRNTSGVIIFALNERAYAELYNGFKERTFEKSYHCLINGAFEANKGVLKDYLVKDEKSSTVKIYNKEVPGSKPVITAYEEIERGDYSSVLKVDLITGRTHQIRAHLAYHGHFIIGDGKYGSERVNKLFKVNKQLLIATSLTLKFGEQSCLYYLNGKRFSVDFSRIFQYLK